MLKVYRPDELRKRVEGKKWVMPYTRLTAIVDPRSHKILYIEEYGPREGIFIEGWRALHYPLTSSIVEKTYREGSSTLAVIKQGMSKLVLEPSFAPFGISECIARDKTVELTFEGVGGAGVSASFSRGMAEGVDEVTVYEEGGGAKRGKASITIPKSSLLLVGVDDTDDATVGATYALVDTLAKEAADKFRVRYMIHVNVQLYPYNDFKTRNCFSTVVGFIYQEGFSKQKIINYFKKELKKHTVSSNTAMAVYVGFDLPSLFTDYCTSLKFRMATNTNELKKLAHGAGIETHVITGERGLFGAIGALGFWDKPDFAAKLPQQCT